MLHKSRCDFRNYRILQCRPFRATQPRCPGCRRFPGMRLPTIAMLSSGEPAVRRSVRWSRFLFHRLVPQACFQVGSLRLWQGRNRGRKRTPRCHERTRELQILQPSHPGATEYRSDHYSGGQSRSFVANPGDSTDITGIGRLPSHHDTYTFDFGRPSLRSEAS